LRDISLRWHCSIYQYVCFLFLGAFVKLRKATVSFVVSLRLSISPSASKKSALTGRILMKFDIWVVFEKSVEEIHVSLKSDKN
jgi:hypothetical protein